MGQEEVAHPVLRQRQVSDAILLAAQDRERLRGCVQFRPAAQPPVPGIDAALGRQRCGYVDLLPSRHSNCTGKR